MNFALTIVKKWLPLSKILLPTGLFQRAIQYYAQWEMSRLGNWVLETSFAAALIPYMHHRQTKKPKPESKGLVKGCEIFGCLWRQHPCSTWSVVGAGVVQLELCVAGWQSNLRTCIPALWRWEWAQLSVGNKTCTVHTQLLPSRETGIGSEIWVKKPKTLGFDWKYENILNRRHGRT